MLPHPQAHITHELTHSHIRYSHRRTAVCPPSLIFSQRETERETEAHTKFSESFHIFFPRNGDKRATSDPAPCQAMSDPSSTRTTANSGDVVTSASNTAVVTGIGSIVDADHIYGNTENNDTSNPVVRRRRRRIIRHVREKTPEPSARGVGGSESGVDRSYRYSDEDAFEVTVSTAATAMSTSFDENAVVDASMLMRRRTAATACAATVSVADFGAVDAAATIITDGDVGVVSVASGTTTTPTTASTKPSINVRVTTTTTTPTTTPVTVTTTTTATPTPTTATTTTTLPTTSAAAAGTHRSKILMMRDRGVGPSKAIRSQSSPRIATSETQPADAVDDATEAGYSGGDTLPRPVKRSLSSQRYGKRRRFCCNNYKFALNSVLLIALLIGC